jgi:hypothetical protein
VKTVGLTSKQRRSRARRRAGRVILAREVDLAATEPDDGLVVVPLLEGPLAYVLEIWTGEEMSIWIGGPGAPWPGAVEARC